jgi:hypothetical protein
MAPLWGELPFALKPRLTRADPPVNLFVLSAGTIAAAPHARRGPPVRAERARRSVEA